jgi:hypothetical protein
MTNVYVEPRPKGRPRRPPARHLQKRLVLQAFVVAPVIVMVGSVSCQAA